MSEPPEHKGGRGNLVGVIIVIVLVIAVAWLARALYTNLQLQKCEAEGRPNCTGLPQPDQ